MPTTISRGRKWGSGRFVAQRAVMRGVHSTKCCMDACGPCFTQLKRSSVWRVILARLFEACRSGLVPLAHLRSCQLRH